MKLLFCKISLILLLTLLTSCMYEEVSVRTITRTEADKSVDVSGRWNDTDGRLVAEDMVASLVSQNWLSEFVQDNGRPPVVIVGRIRNRSEEHIDVLPLIKDIERSLINSNKVTFVASANERSEIRTERTEQQEFASEETAKSLREETGADYMLIGVLTSQIDAVDGYRVVLYQMDMELINIENNQKSWVGTKKIKKIITQSDHVW